MKLEWDKSIQLKLLIYKNDAGKTCCALVGPENQPVKNVTGLKLHTGYDNAVRGKINLTFFGRPGEVEATEDLEIPIDQIHLDKIQPDCVLSENENGKLKIDLMVHKESAAGTLPAPSSMKDVRLNDQDKKHPGSIVSAAVRYYYHEDDDCVTYIMQREPLVQPFLDKLKALNLYYSRVNNQVTVYGMNLAQRKELDDFQYQLLFPAADATARLNQTLKSLNETIEGAFKKSEQDPPEELKEDPPAPQKKRGYEWL